MRLSAPDGSTLTSDTKPLQCQIDGNKNNATFPIFPHLIIVGAQKAGTTALYNTLRLVPGFMPSFRKEPHYLDLRALPILNRGNVTQDIICTLAREYASYWPLVNMTPSTIVFEKTPSLLRITGIPWTIRTFLDAIHPNHPVKILALLRDPVQRFYSNYKMDFQHRGYRTATVEDIIRDEVRDLSNQGLLKAPMYNENITFEEHSHEMWNPSMFQTGTRVPYEYKPKLSRGFYSKQLAEYMKYFTLGENLMVIRYELFLENPVKTMESILKFVTGKDTLVTEAARDALATDLGPAFLKRSEFYHPMSNHSEQYLKLLYKPFNDELADLLGEAWRDVWS